MKTILNKDSRWLVVKTDYDRDRDIIIDVFNTSSVCVKEHYSPNLFKLTIYEINGNTRHEIIRVSSQNYDAYTIRTAITNAINTIRSSISNIIEF